jgi:hypothetical protein
VSYTTIDGGIKKGILMPEYWEPKNDVQQKTVVPISRAMKNHSLINDWIKHHHEKWSFHFQATREIQISGLRS